MRVADRCWLPSIQSVEDFVHRLDCLVKIKHMTWHKQGTIRAASIGHVKSSVIYGSCAASVHRAWVVMLQTRHSHCDASQLRMDHAPLMSYLHSWDLCGGDARMPASCSSDRGIGKRRGWSSNLARRFWEQCGVFQGMIQRAVKNRTRRTRQGRNQPTPITRNIA